MRFLEKETIISHQNARTHKLFKKNTWKWVTSVSITKQSHQVEQHRINIRRNHLQFDGSPWARKGQRWRWPHPPWAGTFGLRWGEARSLSRVYRTVPSVGVRSYPTVKEECTWKTQNRPLHLIRFSFVAFHNTGIKPPLCYSEQRRLHFKRGCRTNTPSRHMFCIQSISQELLDVCFGLLTIVITVRLLLRCGELCWACALTPM